MEALDALKQTFPHGILLNDVLKALRRNDASFAVLVEQVLNDFPENRPRLVKIIYVPQHAEVISCSSGPQITAQEIFCYKNYIKSVLID